METKTPKPNTLSTYKSKKKYPYKNAARRRVYYAIQTGKLKRPQHCPKCGVAGIIEASHNDYHAPLDIEWLCRMCHIQKDKKHGPK